MPNATHLQHIYKRSVTGNLQDSLSIIAGLIEPGQILLDLGMGTGGLGQHLSQQFAILADGVTLNSAEAELARQWYRQAIVADLDSANLSELFDGQQYDCIVCADVLEHLKTPQSLLSQCKALLKPGGRLITSVPNVGYCGLIAELIQGEFRYRPEGLLDNTHLRFFTRKSLNRFYEEQGWTATSLQTTQRDLSDSEFQVTFDSLPPAVARHLLALPDAQTYQFVSVLVPTDSSDGTNALIAHAELAQNAINAKASAMFSAQLYLATSAGYLESSKQVVAGYVGLAQQTLQFDIPCCAEPYRALRLDPADRPGFFRLFRLVLTLSDGTVAWQWDTSQNQATLSGSGHHQQIVFQPPWALSDGVLLFLWGDDPWVELPLTQQVLQQVAQHGAKLNMICGWPMSADYLQASLAMSELQTTHAAALANQASLIAEMQDRYKCLSLERQDLDAANQVLGSQLDRVQDTLVSAKIDVQALRGELQATKHQSQAQINQLVTHLQTIEQSTVFRVTRPLVKFKMQLDQWLGKSDRCQDNTTNVQNLTPLPLPRLPVDIIVPVYRGLEDTRCCIESVLRSTCQTPWRLIVINDQSPEPEVSNWLRSIAATDSRITLLENPQNLGFVGTVNRGMALSADNDVLLLNSDAEVANDWLDRLQRAAYSNPKVASVTPFSNNATICSYPRFCQANDMPDGWDTAALDLLFANYLPGQSVQIPTGVGFCMYVRRACLQQIGLFDVANFGKGYGEENDFCVRAQASGWTNLHTLDTFVRHAGGISFGDSKSERELQAMETLRRLHPRYDTDVQAYVRQDPAQAARMTIDLARIVGSGKPVILNVTHNREGGTLRHIQELAHHLAKRVTFLRLSPAPRGVLLKLEGHHEAFELHFTLPQVHVELLHTLRMLQVGHIHFQHFLGHQPDIANLPAQLGVTYDFTTHDYYSFCPQISLTDHSDRYCREEGLTQCKRCLQRNPAPHGFDIQTWRDHHVTVLGNARYVIAPSIDAAIRIQRYVPEAYACVVPHASLLPVAPPNPAPNPQRLSEHRPLIVAVLGALSKIKGADVLEAVATLAANHDAAVEFHLLGYAYRNLRTQPKAKLTVHGAYDDADLPKLLAWLKPDVVWFPAVWPETYSYTLSACLENGLPVVAPNIGAFAERLQDRPWSWLCDWQQDSATWLAFFTRIRVKNYLQLVSPAPFRQEANQGYDGIQTIRYHGNYLDGLPSTTAPAADVLANLQTQIASSQPKSDHPSTFVKSSALQAILRMRSILFFSPLVKLIPMHTQRRVKSWLRK